MVNMTDDWMNQRTSSSYTLRAPKDRDQYAIQRAYSQVVFGPSGSIVDWREWQTYKTKEEMDTAYDKIVDENPMWRIRKAKMNWQGFYEPNVIYGDVL